MECWNDGILGFPCFISVFGIENQLLSFSLTGLDFADSYIVARL
jgi:hypothetical protein